MKNKTNISFLMSQYLQEVNEGRISITDHDEESVENIQQLVNSIKNII